MSESWGGPFHKLSFAETPIAEVLRTGKPVRDREIEIERLDGERRVLLATVEPLLGK
jgi:hypothetical protein